jgi:hypothetical protein
VCRAGSAKLIHPARQPVGSGGAGGQAQRRGRARADRPADDIGGHDARGRALPHPVAQQPGDIERALAVSGQNDRLVCGQRGKASKAARISA